MCVLTLFRFCILSGTLSRGYSVSNSDRSLSSTSVRDYDGLKQQCDKAMHELQMLRRYVVIVACSPNQSENLVFGQSELVYFFVILLKKQLGSQFKF